MKGAKQLEEDLVRMHEDVLGMLDYLRPVHRELPASKLRGRIESAIRRGAEMYVALDAAIHILEDHG